jgi:ATP-dependent helicase/nuclease subunit B
VRIRLLLGPAGSGKTFRCLAEARRVLADSPDGPPLIFLAPKQATYQLERQLLADPAIPGYTRLHILSFERLAQFVFDVLGTSAPRMLDEEGRLMVLRGLLARNRQDLRLFRASARLTGFAQQLSRVLGEVQQSGLSPAMLDDLSARVQGAEGLALKLQDLARLLRDYLGWLDSHGLQDTDRLLPMAAQALKPVASEDNAAARPSNDRLRIGRLWVDGFAAFSEQELDLLANLVPYCEEATLAFCLDGSSLSGDSWMSPWSLVRRDFERCRTRLSSLARAELSVGLLPRQPANSRFQASPVLAHLEEHWADHELFGDLRDSSLGESDAGNASTAAVSGSLRVAVCADTETEAILAAREVLRHVRAGGRFRDVSVLVRSLTGYHQVLARVFYRYDIPFFLDRRESVSHHPMAELTRSALRTVAFQWQHDDWFAALKTGLVPAEAADIDRLENEALSRGWRGSVWQKPVVVPNDPEVSDWLTHLLPRLLSPFQRLAIALGLCQYKPTGPLLAAALREFWDALEIESQLDSWASSAGSNADLRLPNSVHATVWEQMNNWLANVELAFPTEALSLREWLPVLEAGLSNLSVGVIPPALDQVLIGAIDRSRNPDIKLAILLGLNEAIFPAVPETTPLLNDADREALQRCQVAVGLSSRQQLGRERYLAYIACTRARQRLVLTCAQQDPQGLLLNPSPFLNQIEQLFPSLTRETVSKERDWRESEHVTELVGRLIRTLSQPGEPNAPGRTPPTALLALPPVASLAAALREIQAAPEFETLPPEVAARLYGPTLHTSVSRLEQFAACPFRFFVHSGLRAEERRLFELDVKEQGSFQHEVLALFHQRLQAEGKRWRDLSLTGARERVAQTAQTLIATYREGLLEATEETRFMAQVLSESLQDFVETLVGWMRDQYLFEPAAVELSFGEDEGGFPAWTIELGNGRQLALRGRIDRIDLFRRPGSAEALCVVVDYKSSRKQLDPVLMAHGLQLQLLAYLNVLRRWPSPQAQFGVDRLIPVGVFYVSLQGNYPSEKNRTDALAEVAAARKLAYRHTGRFDARALPQFDARPEVKQGDQFNFRLTKEGQLHKNSREAVTTSHFLAMLDSVETQLRQMGNDIYAGRVAVAPYRRGLAIACDQCSYQAICRIDPWTHRYRVLRLPEGAETAEALSGS